MDAPASGPAPTDAPPHFDAYEAFWHCIDEPTNSAPATGDIHDVGSGDAYAAYQAMREG